MKIGIVGAGIMGRTLALACLNAGWQVCVFDKNNDDASCSMAAAGLLMPYSELDKAETLINTLGLEACTQHWPALLAQLQTNTYFNMQGSLTLCHAREEAELQHFLQTITHKLPSAPYQRLNQQALMALEPELYKFTHAHFCPSEGNLDNQQLLLDLKHYLRHHGVEWLEQTMVTTLQPGKIQFAEQTLCVDVVIDCRGLDAKNQFPDLQGIRGELVWLHAPEVKLKRPLRFLHPRHSLYIAPRPNQCYLVGASEIYSEDNTTISVRTLLELLTTVFYVHSGFAEARLLKTVTHCRPTLPNNLPRIRYTDGLIAVNGLYRHGFLLAPTLAHEIVNYLEHGTQSHSIWEKIPS